MRISPAALAVPCFAGAAALFAVSVSLAAARVLFQLFILLYNMGDQISQSFFGAPLRGSIPLPTGKFLQTLSQEALKGALSLLSKGRAALRQGVPYPASPKVPGGRGPKGGATGGRPAPMGGSAGTSGAASAASDWIARQVARASARRSPVHGAANILALALLAASLLAMAAFALRTAGALAAP